MRSFAQPKVLGRALIAALLSGLACYPRLATWGERGAPVSLLWPVLVWAMFVLWGFVFAWQFEYAHRPVFMAKFNPKLWAITTVCAVAAGLLLHFTVDPPLRALTPLVYPTDWRSWIIMGLWALAFEPLFLCFAPFAFFIRLARRQDPALALTVTFTVFVLALRIHSSPTLPPLLLLVELVALRVLAGFASLYLYLQGGAFLVWWTMFVLYLRYIFDMTGTQ
jgi:hypothetical protein